MYRPTDQEIMADAWRGLQARLARNGTLNATYQIDPDQALRNAGQDACCAYHARRKRSLQSCHRYKLDGDIPIAGAKTKRYVPALSTRIDEDRRLTDGARRCGRVLAGYTYARNREGRTARITVTYLMEALGKCRRTVQHYLRELEAAGYIETKVLKAQTRMCVGLLIKLLTPLLADHHADGWPAKSIKPDAQKTSQNHSQKEIEVEVPLHLWALSCMEGVWRSFNRIYPPGTFPFRDQNPTSFPGAVTALLGEGPGVAAHA